MSDDQPTDQLVIGGSDAPRSRKGRWIGGGVIGLLAVGGAGAWAAASFFATGAQPAQALPDSTIGYVSVDLDPSGGQKINALKVARKFPAFKDKVGLDTDDDLRKWIVEKAADDSGCDIDYAKDVEPWLGSRMAVAAVGTDKPFPVIVVQVTDTDKADAGLKKIAACDDEGLVWEASGDWAVLTETQDQLDRVLADTDKGSLADDADFKSWTAKAGDSGILSAYAAPAAGSVIADELAGDQSSASDSGSGSDSSTDMFDVDEMCSPDMLSDDFTRPDCEQMVEQFGDSAELGQAEVDPFGMLDACPGLEDGSSDALRAKLADFGGAAATLRFSGDGLELEMAGDAAALGATTGSPTGTPVVSTLPADTAVAFGLAMPEGWTDALTKNLEQVCGDDSDPDALFDSLSDLTGLDLPGDLEKLLGDSAALALGSDIDVDGLVNGDDPSDLPVAVKVRGDKATVDKVAAKLPEGLVETAEGDGAVALGFDKTYVTQVAATGKLGDSDDFTSVVPEADKAAGVLYVNADALDDAVEELATGDDEVVDNFAPLRALGMSSWLEGKDAHTLLKVSLD